MRMGFLVPPLMLVALSLCSSCGDESMRAASAPTMTDAGAEDASAKERAPRPRTSAELCRFLDAYDLDHRWRSGWRIRWSDGVGIEEWPQDGRIHTHCSAFVSAVCKDLGIPCINPERDDERGLANRQAKWLPAEGARSGWREISQEQAQALANRNCLVLASLSEDAGHGHIAIVRPQEQAANGLVLVQAGLVNGTHVPIERAFAAHRHALRDARVRFFAHDLP